MKIRIEREWKLGARIDGGGFGEVYEASAVGCESAVAKLVPRVDGGQRELLFVDLGNARNTIPIIEHAETPEYYVLIMPRADKSLRQHIDEAGEPLGSGATVDILIDMVTTLVDLDGRVVHRDLKPENTLLYKNRLRTGGVWQTLALPDTLRQLPRRTRRSTRCHPRMQPRSDGEKNGRPARQTCTRLA